MGDNTSTPREGSIGINHPTVRPANWDDVHGDSDPSGEARISFDGASNAFEDLVRETLQSSDFIEVTYEGDELVAREV